jgi:hypothetical protein
LQTSTSLQSRVVSRQPFRRIMYRPYSDLIDNWYENCTKTSGVMSCFRVATVTGFCVCVGSRIHLYVDRFHIRRSIPRTICICSLTQFSAFICPLGVSTHKYIVQYKMFLKSNVNIYMSFKSTNIYTCRLIQNNTLCRIITFMLHFV